jgi:hypothetical protein
MISIHIRKAVVVPGPSRVDTATVLDPTPAIILLLVDMVEAADMQLQGLQLDIKVILEEAADMRRQQLDIKAILEEEEDTITQLAPDLVAVPSMA